jgi:hypothetical protein
MHIANVQIGENNQDWVKLEDVITSKIGSSFTFKDDTNYYIVNTSGFNVFFIDTDQTITEVEDTGLPLEPKEQLGYKKTSGTLYVKSVNGKSDLHIEEEN